MKKVGREHFKVVPQKKPKKTGGLLRTFTVSKEAELSIFYN
jgi:hypothetical protein